MFNLAPIRYAKVMAAEGGPIVRIEHANVEVFGETSVHVVTYLEEGIVNPKYLQLRATDQPDGAGCHASLQIACYMAISEALERWAVHYCREHLASGMGGIDVDSSSNGFAAFPGLFRRQTRRAAFRESIERHCLISWWEGLLGHHYVEDPWPGVSAISIENPYSSHVVLLIWTVTAFGYAYAFGAGDSVAHAGRRALVELERTQGLLVALSKTSKPLEVGEHGDIFERRISYFAGEDGAAQFLQRLAKRVSGRAPRLELLFDAPVKGPWDRYTSVWRTIIAAPSIEYLSDRKDYFFW